MAKVSTIFGYMDPQGLRSVLVGEFLRTKRCTLSVL